MGLVWARATICECMLGPVEKSIKLFIAEHVKTVRCHVMSLVPKIYKQQSYSTSLALGVRGIAQISNKTFRPVNNIPNY